MNYEIGREYKYPDYYKKYKLKEISKNGFVFKFECGHWVTDLVFIDMIDVKTKIRVRYNTQLSLSFPDI